jgi:hypothetical protein
MTSQRVPFPQQKLFVSRQDAKNQETREGTSSWTNAADLRKISPFGPNDNSGVAVFARFIKLIVGLTCQQPAHRN